MHAFPCTSYALPPLSEFSVSTTIVRPVLLLWAWLDDHGEVYTYHEYERKRLHVEAHEPTDVELVLDPECVSNGWRIVWDGPDPE